MGGCFGLLMFSTGAGGILFWFFSSLSLSGCIYIPACVFHEHAIFFFSFLDRWERKRFVFILLQNRSLLQCCESVLFC